MRGRLPVAGGSLLAHVREQIVAILSASLGDEIVLVPPDDRNVRAAVHAQAPYPKNEEKNEKRDEINKLRADSSGQLIKERKLWETNFVGREYHFAE
jgi:hypothetical protein